MRSYAWPEKAAEEYGACRYWTVTLDGAKVAGRAVDLAATTAIMDSGTTAILVSSADAAAIHRVRACPAVSVLNADASMQCLHSRCFKHLIYRVLGCEHRFCVSRNSAQYPQKQFACRVSQGWSLTRLEGTTVSGEAARH